MHWFEENLGEYDVEVSNRSIDLTTIAIAGPRSRELLQEITSVDIESAAMPFMSVREMDVHLAPCLVASLSYTGELGYEVYVATDFARSVYDRVVEAGKAFGCRPFGMRALMSMGMEKSFGSWSREYTPDYTPVMCGMERWVEYDRPGFIGREAALLDRDAEPKHRLVALEIDALDADAWGYEPIWYNDEYVGFVTSGAYGHRVSKSLAMGYINAEYLDVTEGLSVHVIDQRRAANILREPPYDPQALKMRS
jgi:dimethylglycine dehydrogenase